MGREGWGEIGGVPSLWWPSESSDEPGSQNKVSGRDAKRERRDGDKFQSSQEVWLCGEERRHSRRGRSWMSGSVSFNRRRNVFIEK